MNSEAVQVLGVMFSEEGVQIQYLMPTDVHSNGMAIQSALLVASTEDTKDDIWELHNNAVEALVSWMDDYQQSYPSDLTDDEDDDDERGMGE